MAWLSNKASREFLPKKSKVINAVRVCHSFHSKRCLPSCILYKMERFSFRSGRAKQYSEAFKRRVAYSVMYVYSNNFSLALHLKQFITGWFITKHWSIIKCKCVCIAMWSLVMSLCSHDFLMMSLYILNNSSRLTIV